MSDQRPPRLPPKRAEKVPQNAGEPLDLERLRATAHALNNVAGVVLGNWFVVRDHLKPIPDAWVIAGDIDAAGERLVELLARLTRALGPGPVAVLDAEREG